MFKNNAIASASIKGSPAQFEQQLKEKNQIARGRATAIDYDVKAATVRLTGDAWLTDGQNEIRGNTLIYDIGRERVQANPSEKDPGGVSITINPPKKAPPTRPTRRGPAGPEPSHRHEARKGRRAMKTSRLRAEALGKSYRSRQVVKGPVARGHFGRGGRPARPERRRQDHGVLHDRRAGAVRRRPHSPRRTGTHAPADVPSRAAGRGLPAAGSVRLPQAVGRGQHPRHPRDAQGSGRRRRAQCRARVAARGTAHRPHPREQRDEPVGRRAAARRDRPGAGGRTPLHPAGRTLRRRGPDFGHRHPAHHPPPQLAQHRRTDYRPQRA